MSVQNLYLDMVIAAFVLFGVVLAATHLWTNAGTRKPPKS